MTTIGSDAVDISLHIKQIYRLVLFNNSYILLIITYKYRTLVLD